MGAFAGGFIPHTRLVWSDSPDRTIAENLLREFLHSGENLLGRDGTDGDEFSGFLYDIGARKRRAFCCHCLNDIGDRRKFWALVRALSRLGTRANVCNNLADRVAGLALPPVALELVESGVEVFSLAGFLLPDARHLRVGIKPIDCAPLVDFACASRKRLNECAVFKPAHLRAPVDRLAPLNAQRRG